MPIDPHISSVAGSFAGVASRVADLDRRLRSLEVKTGVMPNNAIQGGHVAAGSIQSGHIQAGSIQAGHIQAGAIQAGHIQAGSIQASHIQAEAIQASHISAGSVHAAAIQAGVITATHIAANTITANEIAANTITAGQIAANTITAGQIEAGTITANEIAANTITATLIQTDAIEARHISADSITTEKIQTGAVTAEKITTVTLSAISTNMGNIVAGTITGGTVQTDTGGSRVVMDSLGLRGYASNGTTKIFEIDAGSGVASFTGVAYIDPASVIPGGTITENSMPGDRIVTASIQTLQLAAGAVKANTIDAGAITAQKISVSLPGGSAVIANGNFRVPVVTAGVVPEWPKLGGSGSSTVEDDTSFGKVLRLQNTSPSNTFLRQQTTLAKGRHVISCWIRTASVTAGGYAALTLAVSSGTATMSGGSYLTGTNDWTRSEIAVNVTSATAVIDIYPHLGHTLDVAGDAWYAQVAVQSSIGSTLITPNAITTDHIFAGTIQGEDIAATTITGSNIAGTTITANKLNVQTLSAITANMGFLEAGTITGATIRTGPTNPRVELDSTGLRQYNSAGVPTVKLTPTGGLDVLAGDVLDPAANQRLRWLTSGGAVQGEMWATEWGGTQFNISARQGTGSTTSINLQTNHNAVAGQRSQLYMSSSGSGLSNLRCEIAGLGGSFFRTIMDSDGKSDFLQLTNPKTLKVQTFTATITMPVGLNNILINLAEAWGVVHNAAFVTFAPSTHWSFSIMNSGFVQSLSQCGITVNNTGAAQSMSVWVISLGW